MVRKDLIFHCLLISLTHLTFMNEWEEAVMSLKYTLVLIIATVGHEGTRKRSLSSEEIIFLRLIRTFHRNVFWVFWTRNAWKWLRKENIPAFFYNGKLPLFQCNRISFRKTGKRQISGLWPLNYWHLSCEAICIFQIACWAVLSSMKIKDLVAL